MKKNIKNLIKWEILLKNGESIFFDDNMVKENGDYTFFEYNEITKENFMYMIEKKEIVYIKFLLK